VTFTAAGTIGCLSTLVGSGSFIYPYPEGINKIIFGAHLIIGIIGLSFSLSLTRNIALFLSGLCSQNSASNFLIACVTLIVTYILICLWTPVTQTLAYAFAVPSLDVVHLFLPGWKFHPWQDLVWAYSEFWKDLSVHPLSIEQYNPTNVLKELKDAFSFKIKIEGLDYANLTEDIKQFLGGGNWHSIEKIMFMVPSYGVNIARLIVAIVFFASFLIKPFVMEPLSLVWRRIVESEKPVFTCVGSGVGTIATAVGELMKHV
jgi:hypothetical protein